MDTKIQIMQINQINIYHLTAFPEERIKNLVSELNVHYDKINNYTTSGISGEDINKEIIDSLAKLNEINRLAPCQMNTHRYSGDFRLGIDLLESVIALLKTGAGHNSTKTNLINLGYDLLKKLYNFSFEELVGFAMFYNWLKKYNLIRSHSHDITNLFGSFDNSKSEQTSLEPEKISFRPSDEELEAFYSKNRQLIYEILAFKMDDSKEVKDPFSDQQARDYYHYYQTLKTFRV